MIRPVLLLALGAVLFATAPAAGADDTSSFPGIDKLPDGYETFDGHVAGLGIPYALGDPTELPTRPIYWVHGGKIIGFEVVIDEQQIDDHIDPGAIQPIAGLPPIDHIDLVHDFAHAKWLNATWTIRVEFVSDYYLARMVGG